MPRNQPGARFAKVEALARTGEMVELHTAARVLVAARCAGCVFGCIQERAYLRLVQPERATSVMAGEMIRRKTRYLHAKIVAGFTP